MQRFLNRVEVRRLRIIDIIDAVDLTHKFAPVRPRLISAERGHHLFEAQTPRVTGGECGHQVLDVMRAAQLCLAHAQHRFVLEHNGAFGQTEVGPVRVSAECDFARPKRRQIFDRIHNRDVVRGLVLEQA